MKKNQFQLSSSSSGDNSVIIQLNLVSIQVNNYVDVAKSTNYKFNSALQKAIESSFSSSSVQCLFNSVQ